MRKAFVNTLLSLARKDKRIILLSGDLGFSVVEQYMEEIPSQYINVGVAEQNMTGLAAGMAMEGKIPLIYSIVPFATMRNFEQIRNDICYQNLNVKIVGVGTGFSYGPYGHTHHPLEDVGIMRTIPNLIILSPADPLEAEECTKLAINHIGPVYLRLAKAGEPIIHKRKPYVSIGKGIVVREGKDVALFSTSALLLRAIEVADELKKHQVGVMVISMPSLKPIDEKLIKNCVDTSKALFTLEEHSIIGGLGSAVSEILAENNVSISFKRLGVPDRFTKVLGLQEYMREANNLTLKQIVKIILQKTKKY